MNNMQYLSIEYWGAYIPIMHFKTTEYVYKQWHLTCYGYLGHKLFLHIQCTQCKVLMAKSSTIILKTMIFHILYLSLYQDPKADFTIS